MSLQDTLKKLDEQKKKAYTRLDEFKSIHESACSQGLVSLKPHMSNFEKEFNQRLRELRKSVMGKLRLLSIEADQKLSAIVEEGRGRIEDRLRPSVAELQSLRDDLGIKEAFAELQDASDKFSSQYTSVLERLRDRDLSKALSVQTDDSLENLQPLLTRLQQEQDKSCEQVLQHIRQYYDAAQVELNTVVESMAVKLQRMKNLDMDKLLLQRNRVFDAFDKADKNAEAKLNRFCEKEFVEKVLPYFAELKNSLQRASREMTHELTDYLSKQSRERVSKFDSLLDKNRSFAKDLGDDLDSLKSSFEKDGKIQSEALLSELAANLDKKLEEFKEFVRRSAEADKDKADTPKKRLLRRVGQVRSNGVAVIESLSESQKTERKRQIEDTLKHWENHAETSSKAAVDELNAEVDKFLLRRQEAKRKLEEKLEKLTERAEAISAEFI